jgi:phenylpyruvate tautomerase PptA (4-oxalocrotonate tautomerase family)
MPYIDVKLTKNLENEQKSNLKAELGKMIGAFPGKSESWLMCNIETDKEIWFRGDNSSDSAFVEVKLFGALNNDNADKFTSLICKYFDEQLDIAPDRVYVRYEGGNCWGWNGSNF